METSLPTLSWRGVFEYALATIKKSWGALLSGTLAVPILAIAAQWAQSGFTEAGFDQATGGGVVWSFLAVGIWLLVLVFWYVLRAPMGHAREVLAAHESRWKERESTQNDPQREELLAALADALREGNRTFYSHSWWEKTCRHISSIDAAYGAELEDMSECFYTEWPGKLRQMMRQVREGAHLAPPTHIK